MDKLSSRLIFGLFLTIISNLINYGITNAQIIPDHSLGAESSKTRPDTIKNTPSDIIEGGATRGSNLFHSFREFNVNEGRGAYFANPDVIQNIFSRVTGGNISQILGTLGVLGNANLFLINPSGIIFGPNARLDMRGAFIGATADSVVFDNNFEFSATNPNAPPLLTVNIPLGLRFRETSADISSTANLATPSHLTLKAGNLSISGTLLSGGDLTLEALDTLTIRDSVISPFIAASGGNLLLLGNQSVDIYALNHPDSGIISGKDLILRSANAVSGDAHYWSGSSFRIEKLDGTLGELVSLYNPIIRASGDVELDSYTGTSLHILAGGYVYIPGTIEITGVDKTGDTLAETVTLSDGSMINLDGSVEPTLDIRAGTTAVGSPFVNTGTPTSADIVIGNIYTNFVDGTGGQVYLTNQYQPNTALSSPNGIIVGEIDTSDKYGGGYLVIDARSEINLTGLVNISALDLSDSDVPSYLGNGGNVRLLSQANISSNSSIFAQGLLGGNVSLISTGDVFLDNGLEINVRGGGGGNITINAQNVSLLNASKLRAGIASGLGTPEAQAGDITINATENVAIADSSLISNALLQTALGTTGNIEITTNSLVLTNGGQISTRTFGLGNAGAVKITVSDLIYLSGVDSNGYGSSIRSRVESDAQGNAGGIEIITDSLYLNDGAQVDASTFGLGNAGRIIVQADSFIALVNSDIFNNVESGAEGNGGSINLKADSLSLTNGSQLQSIIREVSDTLSGGRGNGGKIIIDVRELFTISGMNSDGFLSAVLTETGFQTEGNGGDINITAGSLVLKDDALISATTFSQSRAGNVMITTDQLIARNGGQILAGSGKENVSGNFGRGGDITINVSGLIEVDGDGNQNRSGIFTETSSPSRAGDLTIHTSQLIVRNGAAISSAHSGSGSLGGDGGDLTINASEFIELTGQGYRSSALVTEAKGIGNAGRLTITTRRLSIRDHAVISASTRGQGNAEEIKITATDSISVMNSGEISASTYGQGDAGDLTIETENLLVDSSQILTTTFGQGNAGNMTVRASESVVLKGEMLGESGDIGFPGGLLAQVDLTGEGKGGNLLIETKYLSVSNGSKVQVATFGQGDAGSLLIRASEIDVFNTPDANNFFATGIFAGVLLDPRNTTPPIGNGGNLTIETNQLSIKNGAELTASTSGIGNGGAIKITANNFISIAGQSGIFSQVESQAEGNAKSIVLTTGSLLLDDKAQISTRSLGQGTAGNITITANTIESTGRSEIRTDTRTNFNAGNITLNISDTLTLSNSSLIAETTGEGTAGDITINTPQLNLAEGAIITAQTSASGNGGNITVNAPISVILGENSQLNVETSNAGQAGNIEITSNTVTIGKNAEISATATSTATNTEAGGSITINASNLFLSGKLGIFAETQGESPAGNLTLKPDGNQPNLNIQFTDTALISARTTNQGTGGSINISSPQIINIAGEGKITVETTGSGQAGNINITTQQLNIGNQTEITASTTGTNNAGNINLNANQINLQGAIINAYTDGIGSAGSINLSERGNNANRINLDNSTISTEIRENAQVNPNLEATPSNISLNADTITLTNHSLLSARTEANLDAGTVNINSDTLNLSQNSQIETLTQSSANAGSITINANQQITITNANSGLFAQTSSSGVAGNITINTPQFTLADGAKIQASTSSSGNGGNIIVHSPISTTLGEKSQLNVETSGAGQAGNIDITSNTVTIGKDAQISATATSTATNSQGGGSININASNLNIAGQLGIFAETKGQSPAGTLTLNPDSSNPNLNIRFIEQGLISASTTASGNGGDINISAPNNIDISGNGAIATSTSGSGNAGTINLNTSQLTLAEGIEVTASTTGTGNAGDINLDANQINLQQATVTAFTNSGGNAGSITVPNAQAMALDNSTISTEIQAQGTATKPSNITLTSNTLELNNSNITASTSGVGNAGDITLINRQLELNNSSVNATSTGRGDAGSISLPTTQNLNLNQSQISVSTTKEGNAGNITVLTAQNININQSQITASTLGVGETGTIELTGTEQIELNESEISNAVETGGMGNAQTITLNTPHLSLQNSSISSSTDGTGNAGSIFVPNAQTITLDNSTISTEIQAQGVATEASNITIQTQQLTLDNNSQITATTSGDGDAGTITITADSLRLTNRSSIQTNTATAGIAGDLVFNLSNDLTLDNSTLEASTSPNSTGNGGSISIVNPTTVNLNNNARISVNSQGTGDGGNLSLASENLFLNERSSISATTASGEGGNITLNVTDTVTQRNNSPISATAGGTGNGGNITINTRFLVGNENSNITANAFQGRGGNINITADGIFRGFNSPISASSQLGVDGVVDTNTPEVDPSRGLLNLPQNLVDPNTLIAQNACRRGGESEFTVSGRGGLPNTPEQVQRSNEVEVGLVDATEQTAITQPKKEILGTRKIIPAQGWQRNDKGEMVLVATPTTENTHRQTTTTTPNCSLN